MLIIDYGVHFTTKVGKIIDDDKKVGLNVTMHIKVKDIYVLDMFLADNKHVFSIKQPELWHKDNFCPISIAIFIGINFKCICISIAILIHYGLKVFRFNKLKFKIKAHLSLT